MTHKHCYVVEDIETGLIDGYYTSSRGALRAALRWQDRTDHEMIVRLAWQPQAIPEASMLRLKYKED